MLMSTLHRRLPHRHHRLIALVLLLVLVLLALPLLGQHTHATAALPHGDHHGMQGAGTQTAQTTSEHCAHRSAMQQTAGHGGCHCLHACTGVTPLLTIAFAISPIKSPTTPQFSPAREFAPAITPAPPYRPPANIAAA